MTFPAENLPELSIIYCQKFILVSHTLSETLPTIFHTRYYFKTVFHFEGTNFQSVPNSWTATDAAKWNFPPFRKRERSRRERELNCYRVSLFSFFATREMNKSRARVRFIWIHGPDGSGTDWEPDWLIARLLVAQIGILTSFFLLVFSWWG